MTTESRSRTRHQLVEANLYIAKARLAPILTRSHLGSGQKVNLQVQPCGCECWTYTDSTVREYPCREHAAQS